MDKTAITNKRFVKIDSNDIEQTNFCISYNQDISFLDTQLLNVRFARFFHLTVCKTLKKLASVLDRIERRL